MKNTKLKDEIVLESKGKRRSNRNAEKSPERNDEKNAETTADNNSVDEEAKANNDDTIAIQAPCNKIKEKCQSEVMDRKVLVYEEELATSQGSLSDLNAFQSTCRSIESIVTEINQLKTEGNNVGKALLEKRDDALMLTANLKKLNRLVQIRGKKAKENTLEVKSKVDGMHLELQNLLYEVMHMKKEIEQCMNFSSKDEDIDLVSVDKFYNDAPEEISKPDVTKDDPHKQMLSRLAWELKHRKELAAEKYEYMEQKKKIDAEIIEKSDYLVNLKPRLDQIIKATLPVQEFMGMPIEAERLIFEKAQFLPRPLYVLYIQAKAFKDVCDSGMFVDIEGDIFEAKAEFHNEEVNSDYSDDSDVDQNETAETEGKRSRRSKADQTKDRLDLQKKRLFRKHPLLVHIKLVSKGQYELLLEFSYLSALRVSTVKVKLTLIDDVKTFTFNSLLEPSVILKSLLCTDDGKISPNPSNVYQLKKVGITDISTHLNSVGIPYYWVQWICGLNYTPTGQISCCTPDSLQITKHFQSVIKTIKSRLDARLSLVKQVQSLEQLIIPPVKKKVSDVQPKVVSCLSSWKYSPWEDCQNISSFKEFLDEGLVTEECTTYRAIFTRESKKSLNSLIILHESYPKQPPLILLSMENGVPEVDKASKLACLEREINVYTDELLDDKNMILSSMLQKLQVCFDIFVETGINHTSKEKLYTRRNRGRDRNRPYHCHKDGYFIHR